MKLTANPVIMTFVLFFLTFRSLLCQENTPFRPFFFIQLTDPQFGMYEADKGYSKETGLYEKAVATVNRIKPEFVVITGDLVNNRKERSQIDEFRRITAEIRKNIPVYIIPGNHDIPVPAVDNETENFIKDYGSDRFSFTKNGCLFIGINSSIIKSGQGKSEEEQFNWISKLLDTNRSPVHIILFSHYPFFIKSADEPDSYSNVATVLRTKYLSLFNKYNVEAVFSGHLHVNDSSGYMNTKMISTCSVGKPLGKDPSGIRIIKVMKDRTESIFFPLDKVPDTIRLDQ
jgi:serine/threonine-protein phosphatase CPPED1